MPLSKPLSSVDALWNHGYCKLLALLITAGAYHTDKHRTFEDTKREHMENEQHNTRASIKRFIIDPFHFEFHQTPSFQSRNAFAA